MSKCVFMEFGVLEIKAQGGVIRKSWVWFMLLFLQFFFYTRIFTMFYVQRFCLSKKKIKIVSVLNKKFFTSCWYSKVLYHSTLLFESCIIITFVMFITRYIWIQISRFCVEFHPVNQGSLLASLRGYHTDTENNKVRRQASLSILYLPFRIVTYIT